MPGTTLIIDDCFPNDDRFRWASYIDSTLRPSKNTYVCIFPALPLLNGRYRTALFP